MANHCHWYRAPHFLFPRFAVFVLSVSAFALFATTLHIYNSSIAPTDSLGPLNDNLLITNSLPLVPLTISILWSTTQIALLARRIRRAHRQDGNGLSALGYEGEAWDARRLLVHPGWDLGIDFVCGVFLLVVTVFTGIEVTNWKAGRLNDGPGGTRLVDLKACPSFDPGTGLLDYWCEDAWNTLVGFTCSGSSIMGTIVGFHFTSFIGACYNLYHLRRLRRAEELHRKHPPDQTTAAPPPYVSQDVELKSMERGGATVY